MSNQLVSEADVEQALHWLVNNDHTMAEAHTNAEIMEQKRKRLIAVLMNQQETGSAAAREMKALADPRYLEFLDGDYARALRIDQELKLKAKALNTKIDVYRTISANQRRG